MLSSSCLTSNYQAEYGRSGGGAIQIVTKSGTSEFHGTGYYFHRHEQFNANNFLNKANGRIGDPTNGVERNPRNLYRYNQQGYNVGGPIYFPKKIFGPLGTEATKEKLFFFWSQEWQEQLVPQDARQSRVPTALELAGDFSQTRDGNGVRDRHPRSADRAALPRITSSRQAESTQMARRSSTFSEGSRTQPLGGADNGYRYNHNSQLSVSYPRKESSIRLDYNITDNNKIYVRYTRDSDQQIMPYGLGWTGGNNQIPFDNLIFKQAPAWNSTLNLTSVLSPTLTNEFIFGASQNNLTLDPTVANAASYSGIGFTFALPFAGYPESQWFNITFGGIPNHELWRNHWLQPVPIQELEHDV